MLWILLLVPSLVFADVSPSTTLTGTKAGATVAAKPAMTQAGKALSGAPATTQEATPAKTATTLSGGKASAAPVKALTQPGKTVLGAPGEPPATLTGAPVHALTLPGPNAKPADTLPGKSLEGAKAANLAENNPTLAKTFPPENPDKPKANTLPGKGKTVPVADMVATPANACAGSVCAGPATAENKAALPPLAGNADLRLKASMSSPVVMTLPLSEVTPAAQDAGAFEGKEWMSVEKPVTLTGYVAKGDIDKDLDVTSGATVWADPEKTGQLTVVDNPSSVKLLEVDRMGKVEVTEPRVLYYTTGQGAKPAECAAPEAAPEAAPGVHPVITDVAAEKAPASPAHPTLENAPAANLDLMSVEGVLKKGNPLFGPQLSLFDNYGGYIADIDPKSPLDILSMEQYLGKIAVYEGTIKEKGSARILTVHSIRLE